MGTGQNNPAPPKKPGNGGKGNGNGPGGNNPGGGGYRRGAAHALTGAELRPGQGLMGCDWSRARGD